MASAELFQEYLSRFEEAQLYFDQGIKDIAVQIFEELLKECDASALEEAEKDDLRTRVQTVLQKVEEETGRLDSPESGKNQIKGDGEAAPVDPLKAFDYACALMDGQFWDDAIRQFKRAAAIGDRVLECWELCGDCAAKLSRWEEAIGYYEIVYTNPALSEDVKQKVFHKITSCSQKRRKRKKAVAVTPAATPRDASDVTRLIGEQASSWKDEQGVCLVRQPRSYKILNVLHVGITSSIVEFENEETGRRYAGQSISAPFNQSLSPKDIADWVYMRSMADSSHLVKIYDLASCGDVLFIVREYLPLALADLLSEGKALPLPLAVYIAYCVLEGLGDLHLRMGQDRQIRNIFHLDLRPSQVLVHDKKSTVKINNGGLWKVIEERNPKETNVKKLPLAFLAYRAPEQFRSYLSRRKPPVFTDIYLFGALFYHMLTGTPAFSASSYEEYEMQHCDQYPTPPKVWKPEIPDELNDLIMKCLERDPFKRWRSTTEISLFLQKSFNHEIYSTRTAKFTEYLAECRGT